MSMIVGVNTSSPTLRNSCLLYYYNGNFKSILRNGNDYVKKSWSDCSIGINGTQIYVVGTAGDNNEKFVVFTSTDSGDKWTAQSKNNENHYFYNCCSANGNYMFVARNNDVVLYSDNYGNKDFKSGESGKKSWEAIDCNRTGLYVIACSSSEITYSTNNGMNYGLLSSSMNGIKSICVDEICYMAYALDACGLQQIIISLKTIQQIDVPFGKNVDSANPDTNVQISSYNTIIISDDGKYCCICSCVGVIFIRNNSTGVFFQTNPIKYDSGKFIEYADLTGSSDLKIIYAIASSTSYKSILYTTNRGGIN